MAESSVVSSNGDISTVGDSSQPLLLTPAFGFAARLNARSEEKGLKQADLHRMTGLSRQSLSDYFLGRKVVGTDGLFALADALEVDPHWLVRGGGQPSSPEEVRARIEELLDGTTHDLPWLARQVDLSASKLREQLRRGSLEPGPLSRIASVLNVSVDWILAGRTPKRSTRPSAANFKQPPATASKDLVQVPEIDPSFGLGAVFMDEAAAPEMRTFSRSWLRQITTTPPDELYWAAGRGNSMAPTIEDGEPVLIDRRQQSPRDADLIWAFAWGDIGAIKRLRPMPDGSVKILSDNPAVPPESAHGSEIHIFGRVVAVVKNL